MKKKAKKNKYSKNKYIKYIKNKCIKNKYIKRIWIAAAIFIIILALVFSIFRALTPLTSQYKGEVEQRLSLLLGQPVTVKAMETGWHWFQPVLKLNQVVLNNQQNHTLILDKLVIGIDLLSSIWHWSFEPGLFYIDKVNLHIKQTNNGWELEGLQQDQTIPFDANTYNLILHWILEQKKIVIKDVSVTVQLQNGMTIPLTNVFLSTKNHYGRYQIRGEGRLQQEKPTDFTLLADLEVDPSNLSKTYGNVFFSLKKFSPSQWQSCFPSIGYYTEGGEANVDVWLDIQKGRVINAQSKVDLNDLSWAKYEYNNKHTIKLFNGNFAWRPTEAGWQISGDQINLITSDAQWPVNSLIIDYRARDQEYRVFLEKLLLKPLLKADILWPEPVLSLLNANPEGELLYNQIHLKNDQLEFLLTQFHNLSWQAKDAFPGVSNLSGVVYWQPNEGRIEIDSKQAEIKPLDLPPILFDEINGALDWKELSYGNRITLESVVLAQKELIVSARGALDSQAPDEQLIHLNAEFSGKNAQQWLKYIPAKYLKPKLNTWLKNDIKRIDQMSGEISVDGLVNDFPFENTPGTFTINTHVSDVDLIFKEGWPLAKNIEGYIKVNKRTLEADVIKANLLDVVANEINLRVDNLGLEENMYVHGRIETPANSALQYVLNSPLKKALSRLSILDMDGLLNVDLRLEIPLHPAKDKVLARGAVTFNDNHLTVHHRLQDIQVNNIKGVLLFDQEGVTNSALEAILMGDPVSVHVRSVRDIKGPYTELRILGNTTIEVLKNKFQLPIFSFMKGHLALESILTLTDDPNDLDHIRVNSDLQGVSLTLPPPFGKKFNEVTPLSVDIYFNPKRALRIRTNYADRLSTDLWIQNKKSEMVLKNGEIFLGKGNASLPPEDGIKITGVLPVFEWKDWVNVFAQIPQEGAYSSSDVLNKVNKVDVLIHSLHYDQETIHNLSIKAHKRAAENWEISLKQNAIDAVFQYDGKGNNLNGSIKHLYLEKSLLAKSEKNKTIITLQPSQIPNLSLSIHELMVGKVNLGNVVLQSKSTPTQWNLEHCTVTTPVYNMKVKGTWTKEDHVNHTAIEGSMKVTDLAKTLQHWNVSPAVEAEGGQIYFKGGWRGGIHEFALNTLNGNLYIELEDGRITNLSRETEKKLGMGKLLSILSLQTIPRRLKLDFSDLSSGGYSFDEFKGNFTLKNGVMSTEDSYIDGPVAYAKMQGDLDLVKKLYNMNLRVNPHITASLPIVATIAGGPVAGIATWVASKIINQSVQKISGYTYTITGPWQDPIVQQVSIYKKDN